MTDLLEAPIARPFITEEELRRVILPPRVEIVADLLPVGAVVVSAEPGLGKSFLAMTMEHYLAFSTPMGNWPLQEPRRCLVIDFESDEYLIQGRSFAVTPFLASDVADEIPDDAPSIKLMRDDQGYFGIAGSTPEARIALLEAELRDAIEDGDPYSYVRVDTLKMFIGSPPRTFSGNIYDWENGWCVRLNRLAQAYGVVIVLLHHTNKAGESSGSTGIAGGVTSLIKMHRNEEQKHELILESLKTRASAPFRCVLIQNAEGKPEFTDSITVTQAELVGLCREIADLLHEKGPLPLRAILAHCYRVRKETVKSALNRMSGKRRIESYLGKWQLIPGGSEVMSPESEGLPIRVSNAPRRCSVCKDEMVPMMHPDQLVHAGCVAPPAAPTEPDAGETPTEEEVPGKWSGYQALKDSIAGSRMHPVRFIGPDARDRMPWPLFTGDDNAVGEQMTGEHRWTAKDAVIPDSFKAVAVLDRSGSYPSACSSVRVAPNLLQHTGPDGDPSYGGIFQIQAFPWTDKRIGHPLGKIANAPGPWWISGPHMQLLMSLWKGTPTRPPCIPKPVILDSWTGKPAGNLFADFSRAVRAERARARTESPAEYALVKRVSSQALRALWNSKRSPFWRPDWSIAVRAEAAVRHWAVAYRAVLAGEVLLGLGVVDEAVFLMPLDVTPDDTWAPAGYEISAQFGGVHHKDDVRIAAAYKVPSPISVEQWRIRVGL